MSKMKIIETHQLNDYAEHDTLFFTKEGIIVDCRINSPFLHFSNTVKQLGITINAAYLDNSVLIVQCQLFNQINENQFQIYPTKNFLSVTSEHIQHKILRAAHWLTWDAKLQYCHHCGDKLYKIHDLLEKKCRSCDLSFFPNLAPAVIVLVQREDEILLARSPHFKPGIYGLIAGFIDIGETAEAAAHREVKEEVGIEISQLEYFGSQSWPFPNSFMIAFKAHYLRGDLQVDKNELEDAKWFNLHNLPEIPSYASIGRKLIESWR